MSGIDEPGAPPEVPEEYAAIYRDAYERALAEEGHGDLASELLTTTEIAPEPTERPSWLVPVGVAAAVVLVLCAFVLGKVLSSDDSTDTSGAPAASGPTHAATHPAHRATHKPTPAKPRKPRAKAWTGAVAPVAIDAVTATCTARPGTDSAGRPVRYDAANTVDHDPSTAWRCDGRAIGTVLTLTLPRGTPVGQVGLIPGYAKTDPRSGADRYAENNRITKVRWTLATGSVVVQRLDPSPDNRKVQLLRVPRTASGTVTVEILAVARGARNTTAISEIAVYRAR